MLSIPEPHFQFGEKRPEFIGNILLYIDVIDDSDPKDPHRASHTRHATYTTLVETYNLTPQKVVTLLLEDWPKQGWKN